MFPIRIKAYPGEALTSFMFRFSKANGVNFITFWDFVKNKKYRTVRRSDSHLIEIDPTSTLDIDKVAQATRLSSEQLLQMTFYYAIKKFSHSTEITRARILKGVIRDNLQYCPLCMKENPCVQLFWKVRGIDYCIKHQVGLLKKCTKCNINIRVRYLHRIESCYNCGADLARSRIVGIWGIDIQNQYWLIQIWTQLCMSSDVYISPNEVARKILFILNESGTQFNKDTVGKNLMTFGLKLNYLLQIARGTLAQIRAFHIDSLINILQRYRIEMQEFINFKIPSHFNEMLESTHRRHLEQVSCLSPWCLSYMQPGSLVKTGTSTKYKSTGEKLSYHVACLDCGCQFAFNEEGNIQEKDYFNIGYHKLLINKSSPISISGLSRDSGLKIDICRRIIAYFSTRNIFEKGLTETVEPSLVERFISAIKNNLRIAQIQKWDCWNSVTHFYIYRFHPSVMKELILYKRQAPLRINDNGND